MSSYTKLMAILLTDLSGFTSFTAQSDRSNILHAVHQQKTIIEPIIDSFKGRIVKWIGDAALAAFDSATDAILCGREIQKSFLSEAERGDKHLPSSVKVVVHVGEVNIDADGDIYGDAVNIAARMEKASEPDEIYVSDTVRRVIPRAEIPLEFVGEYEFKGVPEKTPIYRTCFGQSPVLRERVILVQTNFVGLQTLADTHGWDVIHPVADAITAGIIESSRDEGGTNRGVMQTGCFLTFNKVGAALAAVAAWSGLVQKVNNEFSRYGQLQVRTAIHRGTLHIMKYTMLGEDVDIVRTLSPLGFGSEVLLTQSAYDTAIAEAQAESLFTRIDWQNLRESNSRRRWESKFTAVKVYRVRLDTLLTAHHH